MKVLTDKNFAGIIEEEERLFVIDLYADWCAPCRMLAPTLAELESEYPDVCFCKINVDEQPTLAAQFRVESIPMVAFVKNDTFLDLTVGVVSKEELAALIREYTRA